MIDVRSFVFVVAGACALGCAEVPAEGVAQSGAALAAVRSCVVDTIQLTDAVEAGADLRAAFDARYVQHPAGAYPHVYLSKAFESPIVPSDEFGTYVYSFHGWDIVPRDLALSYGATEAPAGLPAGLYAVLEGASGSPQPFDQNRFATAKAIFDALTRATETTTRHVVAQPAYDSSWTRTRRASLHNRLFCDRVTLPGPKPVSTRYRCVLTKVEWKTTQAYDPADAGDFCAGR